MQAKGNMPPNEPKARKAWEGLAALICVVVVWMFVFIPPVLVQTREHAPKPDGTFGVVTYIVATAFGIGFAISGLWRGGGKNRFYATLALLMIAMYLVPTIVVNFRRLLSKFH